VVYRQKYALVYFIQPIDIGVEFDMSEWPLHITLADVFAVDILGTGLDAKLEQLLAECSAVVTHAIEHAILGKTPVVILDRNNEILNLHYKIVELLSENGAEFNNPEFTREGFAPHSTVQKQGSLRNSESILIDSMALVDMFPDENWQKRRILSKYTIG
jgi:hypothetical protein